MVSTHLKNIGQNGNFPQIGMKNSKQMKPPPRQFFVTIDITLAWVMPKIVIHPGKSTWNKKNTQLKRKIIWTKPPWRWVPAVNPPTPSFQGERAKEVTLIVIFWVVSRCVRGWFAVAEAATLDEMHLDPSSPDAVWSLPWQCNNFFF